MEKEDQTMERSIKDEAVYDRLAPVGTTSILHELMAAIPGWMEDANQKIPGLKVNPVRIRLDSDLLVSTNTLEITRK